MPEFHHYSLSKFAVNTDTRTAVNQVLLGDRGLRTRAQKTRSPPLVTLLLRRRPHRRQYLDGARDRHVQKIRPRRELVHIASSGTNIQALLGGSLELSAPGMSGVVLAAPARGAPVLTIGAMTNKPPMTLYVQPEITRTDQLKGQSLGITRYNSTAHTVTTLILRKFGMEKTVTQSARRCTGGPSRIRTETTGRHGDGGQTARTGSRPAQRRRSRHPLRHERHGGHPRLSA